MGKDYFPDREAEVVNFTRAFLQGISADAESFGLSDGDVAQYAVLRSAFVESLAATKDPETRTRPATERKRVALQLLERDTRRLVRIVQATPGVTDAMRAAISINTARPGGDRSLVGRPESPPRLQVVSCGPREVTIRLSDKDSIRRGRPRGVAGAAIFVAFQTEMPDSADAWDLHMLTTETTCTLRFKSDVPAGATVWITANWLSPRLKAGVGAAAVCTNVIGGVGHIPMGVLAEAA